MFKQEQPDMDFYQFAEQNRLREDQIEETQLVEGNGEEQNETQFSSEHKTFQPNLNEISKDNENSLHQPEEKTRYQINYEIVTSNQEKVQAIFQKYDKQSQFLISLCELPQALQGSLVVLQILFKIEELNNFLKLYMRDNYDQNFGQKNKHPLNGRSNTQRNDAYQIFKQNELQIELDQRDIRSEVSSDQKTNSSMQKDTLENKQSQLILIPKLYRQYKINFQSFQEILAKCITAVKIEKKEQLDVTQNQQLTLRQQLEETIKQYKTMMQQNPGSPNFNIQLLINDLEQQIQALDQKEKQKQKEETQFKKNQQKGLKEIFNFYANIQLPIGKAPTFDQYQEETQNLNISKYFKFCKDFQLLG